MAENSGDLSLGYMMGQSEGGRGGGSGGFGGFGEGIWAVIILAILFGRGGFGWGGDSGGGGNGNATIIPYAVGGGFGGGGCVTNADLCSQFNFNNLENSVRGIQQGICDSTYALNNSIMSGFHGVDNAICSLGYNIQAGFNGVERSMSTLGYQTQAGFNSLGTQLADCCCKTNNNIERGFADTNYNLATQFCNLQNTLNNNTRDIVDNQNAGTRAILDFLTQDKIASLQAENQTLKFQASQAQQNAFITANQEAQTAELIRRLGADCPVPSYLVQPPTPINFPINGCGTVQFSGGHRDGGCGCGCGCGY